MPALNRGPINTRPFETRARLCVRLSAAHPVHRVGRAARKLERAQESREMVKEMERSCERDAIERKEKREENRKVKRE